MTILVTGGAGFIGSNFVLNWLNASDEPVVNLDKPTYADNLQNLASLKDDARHHLYKPTSAITISNVQSGEYQAWMTQNYTNRNAEAA